SRAPLGRPRPRARRIARLLAQEARLSRRVARPPRKGGAARGGLGRRAAGLHVRGYERRPRAARAPPNSELARAPVPTLMVSLRYAIVLPAYLAGLLALDTQVGLHVQLTLGALTFLVLAVALRPLPPLVRAQAIGVVLFATVGEVTGSLVWGVYHYRLHNLPLFIPPAHGLVYLSGVALSRSLRARAVVWAAAVGAAAWGIAGLTVLPRLDVAGALGVALPLAGHLRRSLPRRRRARAVRDVDRHLALGLRAARPRRPGRQPAERRRRRLRLVRRDGAARRAVARLLRRRDAEADALGLVGRGAELDPAQGADRHDERVGVVVARLRHVERHHAEARLGIDPLEDEARSVGELDLDHRLLDAGGFGEGGDRLVQPLDER